MTEMLCFMQALAEIRKLRQEADQWRRLAVTLARGWRACQEQDADVALYHRLEAEEIVKEMDYEDHELDI